MTYSLEQTAPPSTDLVERTLAIFRERGVERGLRVQSGKNRTRPVSSS